MNNKVITLEECSEIIIKYIENENERMTVEDFVEKLKTIIYRDFQNLNEEDKKLLGLKVIHYFLPPHKK